MTQHEQRRQGEKQKLSPEVTIGLKHLRFASLAVAGLLLISCTPASPKIVTIPPRPCNVPEWPAPPQLEPGAECTEDAVCLTVDSAVKLGEWVREVYRYHAAIALCSNVVEVAPLSVSFEAWTEKMASR